MTSLLCLFTDTKLDNLPNILDIQCLCNLCDMHEIERSQGISADAADCSLTEAGFFGQLFLCHAALLQALFQSGMDGIAHALTSLKIISCQESTVNEARS